MNHGSQVVHMNVIWDELERRKPLSLRERFEIPRTHAEALADFFSAVEMVPPMIVYAKGRESEGEPLEGNEESGSDA